MSVCCGSKPLGLGAAPFAAVGRRESVVSTWPCASLLRPCYSALSALHPPVGGRRAWHTVGAAGRILLSILSPHLRLLSSFKAEFFDVAMSFFLLSTEPTPVQILPPTLQLKTTPISQNLIVLSQSSSCLASQQHLTQLITPSF